MFELEFSSGMERFDSKSPLILCVSLTQFIFPALKMVLRRPGWTFDRDRRRDIAFAFIFALRMRVCLTLSQLLSSAHTCGVRLLQIGPSYHPSCQLPLSGGDSCAASEQL